jgi:hypothetical protein
MSVIAKTELGVNLWLNIFCYVDERLNGPVHWLARRGKCVMVAHHTRSVF